MALLDRRVLIDAPPEIVWKYLSNLADLPRWHPNCTQTSILTTSQRGVGVRRRNTMKKGPSVVEEIVSWYEGLGYEYVVVDGPRYRRNRGLLRLQAIPEGTILQWTFDYQLGGLLGGLRDRLFVRRRLDKEIADGLNQFKRLIQSTGVRMDAVSRDKVAMRPAPNADERAALGMSRSQRLPDDAAETATPTSPGRPRSMPPVIFEDDLPVSPPPLPRPVEVFEDDLPPAPLLEEPPVAEEDTRPRLPAAPRPAEITRPMAALTDDDLRFRPPAPEPAAADLPSVEAEPDWAKVTQTVQPVTLPDDAPFRPPVSPEPAVEPEPAAPSEPPAPVGPSIWEIFGVPRPSEVLSRAQAAPESAAGEATPSPPPSEAALAEPAAPAAIVPPPVEAPVRAAHPGLRARRGPTPGQIRARCAPGHPGLRRKSMRQHGKE